MRYHTSRQLGVATLLSLSLGLAMPASALAMPHHAGLVMIPAKEIMVSRPNQEIVTLPQPLPLPGQLKPVPDTNTSKAASSISAARVNAANAAARVQPVRDGFLNAIQQYPFAEGALYQVYTAIGQVTDIALQEGEQLVGSGPVAAGDTARWIIGDTISGGGSGASGVQTRVHILVKPTRANLSTNLVINTDRRTYHLELKSTPATYMASLSWTYPQDELIALRTRNERALATAPIASDFNVAALDFGYALKGDKPRWRPLRVFNDGGQVFIEFPESIARDELPPLFVVGPAGKAELVNYRYSARFMIVDRLFETAELRLGDRHSMQTVKIVHRTSNREQDKRP
ncbi:conjugal transfer protein TrbG [Sphingopyxis sp. H071]|jgi:P-type conjugative transfer protein TrbG|uniref:P-type conjugative transfer protein TrbG n=1 Tax=unclassified Sphingopyxis TaxID=2614943 RepID=UPI000730FDBF|nr:conjugal transfer protein TrbG [Sphingopyxis sp. H057]KTE50369.1 conjugal transfer protein TrbG [Sphingopyxis sp. H073]KTE52458.1 conjugal transfer protein TrbG [Sphingopyxis sp. H071]KTE62951.1 conjugal transfer protein TrbG [Sphingopyxis sp. H107]KTE64841.1 conjugal transfer protein TrbG [Sphingopyxis sp. H100]KTE72183.1 conjugal transfer protein TrbG [Sphingopyxis sp. H081]KTE79714.1 conjugal transfer protein TrbG [Sphingopyxis sp. H067]